MFTGRDRYLLYVYFLDFNRMVGHRDVYRNVAIKSKKFIARSGWLKICYVDFVIWMKIDLPSNCTSVASSLLVMATFPSTIQSTKSAHFPEEVLCLISISSGFMSMLIKNDGASGKSTTHLRPKPALTLPPPKAHRKFPERRPAAVHSARSSALMPLSASATPPWMRKRFLGLMTQGTTQPPLGGPEMLLEEDMMERS